jgi:L-fuconolactonase
VSEHDSTTRFGRITPPNKDWLAQAPAEAVLEPDLPIVDTHHHLWDHPHRYRYLLDEFLADLATGHNVTQTVFVQCHAMYRAEGPEELRPLGETEFVAGVAAMSESGRYGGTRVAAGIVGFADLTLGDRLDALLEAHIALGGGRFRGVRHSGAWDADPVIGNGHPVPGLYARPEFGAGLDRLTAHGLSLDAWVFHTQLGEVLNLARAHPDANIVLCHCGGPLGYGPYAGKQDAVRAHWLRSIGEIAGCPNVSVKLGGMMMRLAAYDYGALPAPPSSEDLADYWRPYIEPCIELFGPERCMVESNFPVEKMGIGYAALWNAFKRIAAGASAEEKSAIFSGTARRVYRLP